MVNFSLEGKVALVTGASYGIGFAIASAFAAAGATIVFNDIKQELVDKGLAAYQEKGIKAFGYVCDVTSEEQVNALVAQVEKEVGVIDILVNNAGIIKRIPMCDMSAAEFRQVIDVDLNAPFIVSKAVIPGMIKKGHGKIINICSMMSELGRETVSAYAAAKGGLKMLTRNIASEYGEYNIQCNGIGPGISLLLRQLRCVNFRLMVHAIRSTSSSLPRLRLHVGELLKICRVLLCSWHQMLLISSTVMCFTLTAVFWLISVNNPNNIKPRKGYFQVRMGDVSKQHYPCFDTTPFSFH